jgi:hypothetical protein
MFEIETCDVLKTETTNLESTPMKAAYSSPRLVELGEAARLVQGWLHWGFHHDHGHGHWAHH